MRLATDSTNLKPIAENQDISDDAQIQNSRYAQ